MLLKKYDLRNFVDLFAEYSLYLTIFFLPMSNSLLETFKTIFMISGLLSIVINFQSDLISRKFDYRDFFLKCKGTLIFPAILLFVLIMFSFKNSDFASNTFKGIFFKWGRNILLYFITIYVIRNKKEEKANNISLTLLFIASVIVVDSFVQFLIGIDPIRHNIMFSSDRITATFSINNNFAGWLIAIIPIILAEAIFGTNFKFRQKAGLYFLLLMLLVCLFFTYTRSAMIGLFASCIIFLFKKKQKYIKWFIGVMFGIFLLLPKHIKLYLLFMGGPMGRIDIWKGAWNMVKAHPITGLGINTFSANYPKYRVVVGEDYAHNCFLQMWAEAGILGLAALLNIVFLFYKSALNFFKNNFKFNRVEILRFGLFGGLTATLIHSFFDTNLYCLQLASLFWIMLGLYDGLRWESHKEK